MKVNEGTASPRMLADVLWSAANDHLIKEGYSCLAAKRAELNGAEWISGEWGKTCEFMRELGCDYDTAVDMFEEFKDTDERQGVRYMWLLLAACVAEDEGLTCP